MSLYFLPTDFQYGQEKYNSRFFYTDSNVSTLGTERERVEVRNALEAPPTNRGKYKAWTAKDRAEIGKYADVHGNAVKRRALRSYSQIPVTKTSWSSILSPSRGAT